MIETGYSWIWIWPGPLCKFKYNEAPTACHGNQITDFGDITQVQHLPYVFQNLSRKSIISRGKVHEAQQI